MKLNSIGLRGKILSLRGSDCIDDSNVPSEVLNGRIYLNNHLCPAAGELNDVCSKLRQDRKIR